MVDGFFLNNQLTDFSFSPVDAQGRPVANAVAPGKRPRSSMVPTILLTRDGQFAGAIGSAGGNSILALSPSRWSRRSTGTCRCSDALAAPNLVARGPNFNGEVTKFSPDVLGGLRAARNRSQAGPGRGFGPDRRPDPRRQDRRRRRPAPRRRGADAAALGGSVPTASAMLAKPSRFSRCGKPERDPARDPGPS